MSVIEFNYMFENNEVSVARVQQLAATAKAFTHNPAAQEAQLSASLYLGDHTVSDLHWLKLQGAITDADSYAEVDERAIKIREAFHDTYTAEDRALIVRSIASKAILGSLTSDVSSLKK